MNHNQNISNINDVNDLVKVFDNEINFSQIHTGTGNQPLPSLLDMCQS